MVISPNAYYYYRYDNENASVKSKSKADAVFKEYEAVDRFLNSNPEIKSWANSDKLIRQYIDYCWNYNRISSELRPNFLKHFASDFKKYRDKGELDDYFYENTESGFLSLILSMV